MQVRWRLCDKHPAAPGNMQTNQSRFRLVYEEGQSELRKVVMLVREFICSMTYSVPQQEKSREKRDKGL